MKKRQSKKIDFLKSLWQEYSMKKIISTSIYLLSIYSVQIFAQVAQAARTLELSPVVVESIDAARINGAKKILKKQILIDHIQKSTSGVFYKIKILFDSYEKLSELHNVDLVNNLKEIDDYLMSRLIEIFIFNENEQKFEVDPENRHLIKEDTLFITSQIEGLYKTISNQDNSSICQHYVNWEDIFNSIR
jgi:hypothetical protein